MMKIQKKKKQIFKTVNQFSKTKHFKMPTKFSSYTTATQEWKCIYYLINWKVRNYFAFANIFHKKTNGFQK